MPTGTSLRNVEQGMKVYDLDRHHIGKVEYVRFGDDDPSTPEVEAAGSSAYPEDNNHSIIEDLAEAFRSDDLPEEVRERLLSQGFVRLDADGLFAADRYITPDQITSVTSEGVTLGVSKDDLMKRP
ncbi:hypothetical protein [Devosia sp.]|uniref:hypothetical protein n=1 Tax=Devosia sp. TaxID=1871048 RepID=UPI003A952869